MIAQECLGPARVDHERVLSDLEWAVWQDFAGSGTVTSRATAADYDFA